MSKPIARDPVYRGRVFDFDLAVVGAGIVGLACALAGARRGLRVVVIERDARASGASVRNFGLVTITGQDRAQIWRRARRSREIWLEVAARAGIEVVQRGLWLAARRPEAAAVLDAFMRTDMADGCRMLSADAARRHCADLRTEGLEAVLESPHELRVESRDALPALARHLERDLGVCFRWQTAVHAVQTPAIETSRGPVRADTAIVCPGDDLTTLFQRFLADAGIRRCTLQMLRLESPGFRLPGTLMSDLSLLRYGGFASLPEAAALAARLRTEQPEHLRHGIHLIVAQGGDGSLVIGDSHVYDTSVEPFADERVAALLFDEYRAVTGRPAPAVRERWSGTYASAERGGILVETPAPATRLVMVTSGVGASTGFAVGEEVINDLYQ